MTAAASPEAAAASELSDSLRKEIDAIEDTLDFLDQVCCCAWNRADGRGCARAMGV